MATARLLASRGATLALAIPSHETVHAAGALLDEAAGDRGTVTILDVREKVAVQRWIDSIIQKYSKLDGAANIAAVIGTNEPHFQEIIDFDEGEFDFIMGVNCTGV